MHVVSSDPMDVSSSQIQRTSGAASAALPPTAIKRAFIAMENSTPNLLSVFAATIVLIASQTIPSLSQQKSLDLFEGQTDVGKVEKPGSARYDPEKEEYTISGSGANMWFDHDEFYFVWRRIQGDFILTTRARFTGKGVEAHRKIGWIARSSLDSDSAHATAAVHGDGLAALHVRRTKGGPTEELRSSVQGPDIIQLERKGNTFTLSVARYGETFVTEQVSDLALGAEMYAGLFVCSHNKDVLETAVFRDVRITIPAKENFVPYRDYIGSTLETLDIESGDRKTLYRSPDSLQAPNWTRDGKALIYNSNGRLYRFDLAEKVPRLVDTDFATDNNNDHVLSFDGTMLGISHHSADDADESLVYIVPARGGKPRKITSKGPSYLHGWSPDGKFLVYTGGRNGEFDIYKISAQGGEEIRLTDVKGLDDGAEFTPDGKYIYFNSNRAGTMQIWRMKPDGSDQEQVTSDAFNNWFPHVSPDGKWIVLLSFSQHIDSGDHPFYKQVYIRLMPVAGGKPKVIAYVYGGQGTINVPSWSPDSRKVAFVSNTDAK
jgi:TolB protein